MMSSYLPGYALPSVGRAIDVVPPRKVGISRQGTGRFRPSMTQGISANRTDCESDLDSNPPMKKPFTFSSFDISPRGTLHEAPLGRAHAAERDTKGKGDPPGDPTERVPGRNASRRSVIDRTARGIGSVPSPRHPNHVCLDVVSAGPRRVRVRDPRRVVRAFAIPASSWGRC